MVAKVIPDKVSCLACGRMFLVGGAKNKKRGTKTCSQACNGRVKQTTPGTPCQSLADTQAAYLAGMLDADGHIGLYCRNDSTKQHLRVHVDVSNTDTTLLLWIKDTAGIGSVNKQHAATVTHKASFQWNATNESAVTLLRQLTPYMIVKRERAELAIEFFTRLQESPSRIDLSWQEEYRQRMLRLNQRGPRSG